MVAKLPVRPTASPFPRITLSFSDTRGIGLEYYLSTPEVSRRLMSLPVDPPVENVDPADPFEDEDRPMWSDSDGVARIASRL